MLIRDDHCDLAGEGLHEVVFTYVELFLPSLGECWLVAPPHDFATPRGETEVVSPWQSGGFGKLPEPRLRKRWALWFALFPRLSWVVSVDSLPSLLLELESGNTWWHDFPFWLCLARVVALVGLYGKVELQCFAPYTVARLSLLVVSCQSRCVGGALWEGGTSVFRSIYGGTTFPSGCVLPESLRWWGFMEGSEEIFCRDSRFSRQSPVHNFMTETQISQDGAASAGKVQSTTS
eukprot:g25080.t1